MSNSKIARRVGFGVVKVHSLRISVPWVHLLQTQRGDDLVDVGLLVDDRLPVDLADRADQALRVRRWIVGAV